MSLRGQLDPEGAAAVSTALDALMTPPTADDLRTPAQRRADALVELARMHLAGGDLPAVGGQRPQVGVLVFPQALSPQALSPDTVEQLASSRGGTSTAARLRELAGITPDQPQQDQVQQDQVQQDQPQQDGGQPAGSGVAAPQWWDEPDWADPPWLNWHGPAPAVTAQRLACDCDLFRVIMDPASGMPLDVGRSHRLVPYWIRKALFARDRGCRWPGCTARAEWTDAHHLDHWAEHNGETRVDRCVLLCRWHHVQVHEGKWSIDLQPDTGEVTVTRPDGTPYRIPGTRSTSWNGTATHAG